MPERQAFTEEPYRNIFRKNDGSARFSTTAAAPIIRIPVPKKNEEASDIPKYLLKMIFKKV